MNEEKYKELIEQFNSSPDEFWRDLARDNLHWFKDFEQVFNYTTEPFFEWFAGGKTNISYNCLDINLKKHKNKTAIIYEAENGEVSKLSYQELYEAVCQTANFLKELGVKQGDYVCIYMPLAPESIIVMQACTRIGAIHSVVFAGFSAQALQDRIKDLQARYVITVENFSRKGKTIKSLETVEQACSSLDFAPKIVRFGKESYKNCSKECKAAELDSEHPSFVLYTSGSTGKPKGIVHSTAGYLLWAKLSSKWVFELEDNDVYWCTADIGWITGHSYVNYGPLANAATIFIYEGAPNYPSEERFWQMIEKHQISIFYTAPTAVRGFMQYPPESISKYNLSSLKLLGSVGEPIDPNAWHWFHKTIGNKNCPIADTWWQTETGGIMITTIAGVNEMKPGVAGLPLPGVKASIEQGLLVLDQPVPSMARSIHGDDERYKQTYWSKFKGKYLAGDAASQDSDGYIKIEGRIDDVINVSGHRLGTAELEAALLEDPEINEAAVLGVPHEIKGEAIAVFAVCSNKNSNNKQMIEDLIVKQIGALARPEQINIVEALPKTRSGKTMRRLLKDIAMGKNISGDLSTIEDEAVIKNLVTPASP